MGVAGPKTISGLITAIYSGNSAELSQIYSRLLSENVPAKNIASSLLDELFNNLKKNKDLGEAELIWIYETIARETTWIFSSIVPEKAFEVLMYKVALRRSFFNQKIAGHEQVASVASKPAVEQVEAVPAEPTVAQKLHTMLSELTSERDAVITATDKEIKISVEPAATPVKQAMKEKDLTWEGFLNDLGSRSPVSASNLEQGNTLTPVRLENGQLYVELGFGYSGQVFMDYLNEPEMFQKVVNNLSEYFGVDKNNVHLELRQALPKDEFVSQAEIREQKAQVTMQDRVDEFKSNPLLKEAEKLFNSKVDKVILDQKK
jgi:DNA polymerase-3 subunit gamma/tau